MTTGSLLRSCRSSTNISLSVVSATSVSIGEYIDTKIITEERTIQDIVPMVDLAILTILLQAVITPVLIRRRMKKTLKIIKLIKKQPVW